jgi:hypothetical protein
MSNAALTVLVLVLACLSVAALAVSVLALRRPRRVTDDGSLPTDVGGLRDEVASLRAQVEDMVRHLAVVRYDAFGDMGGRLSWSLALLDDGGDGVVLTSIHGRSDARTYAKNISGWRSEQLLSPEEDEAIKLAKAR